MTDTFSVPEATSRISRSDQVADAALEVLAERGGRGLTHRAVDQEAGLPEGSTSNLFRTRDALVIAALDRHVERETEVISAVRSSWPGEELTVAQVAALLSETVDQISTPPMLTLAAARFELYLEVCRRPELSERLRKVRRGYVELVADLLRSAGIDPARQHATAVLALTEGMTVDLLFHPGSALTPAHREKYISNFLEALS